MAERRVAGEWNAAALRYGTVIGGQGSFAEVRLMVIGQNDRGLVEVIFLTGHDPWRGRRGSQGRMDAVGPGGWYVYVMRP